MRTILSSLAALLLMAGVAVSQTLLPGGLDPGGGPVSLTADEVIYWRLEDRYIARGNVVVTTPRFTIYCDEFEVWNATGEMEARGNVRMEGEEGSLRTDKLRINFSAEEGVIINATLYLAEPHTTISGERLEKIGPGRYMIYGATFTPCRCEEGERPDWSIRARSIDAQEEGYARAKGATFRIKDTPIFYLPYVIFPIKQRRQTGFLAPRIEYSSRDNFEFVLPFYWAAARWCDFTLEEDFILKRGIKQNLEFRWVRGAGGGKLTLFYLDDWLVDENRYAAAFNATRLLTGRVRFNGGLRIVSDNEYVRDFRRDDLSDDPRARSLEGGFLIVAPFESIELYGMISRINDLVGDDVEDWLGFEDNDALVPQRLPRVGFRLAMSQIPRTPLWARIRMEANTFYREGPAPAWDRPGVVHEDEWSERVDFEPSITLPVEYRGIYFIPEAGFRETAWVMAESDNAVRHLAVTRTELGLRVWRIYRRRFKHRVEPRVRYVWIEEIDPSDRPRFDFTDDLSDLHGVELNLDQRLFVRRADYHGALRGYELIRFEITQWVDLEEGEFQWLRGELETRPTKYIVIRLDTRYFLEEGEHEYASAGVSLSDKRRDRLDFTYRYQGDGQQFAHTRAEVRMRRWIAITYSHYLNLDDVQFVDHGAGVILEPSSDCWTLDFSISYRTDPEEFRYALRFALTGLGSAGR